jgi:hypothetical protein
MNKTSRLLAAPVLAALLLGSAAIAAAQQEEGHVPPTAATLAATGVTDSSTTLKGEVTPNSTETKFRFEYGSTTSYGQSTPEGTLDASTNTSTVAAVVNGLTPDTVYHFRVKAYHTHADAAMHNGEDQSFTTGSAEAPPENPPATPTDSQPAGAGSTVTAAPSTAASRPVLGSSVVVAPLRGTITVKRPGSSEFITLEAGVSIPVGSLVDSKEGLIGLTSSLGAGKTQTGLFTGGLFEVRQAHTKRGTTEIFLRGRSFAGCRDEAGQRLRAASGRTPKPARRHVWAHDKGGRFRTHGRNSVATVRGTTWATIDSCAGTHTKVIQGVVAVRDRGLGKTVLVRAGHSYLARTP